MSFLIIFLNRTINDVSGKIMIENHKIFLNFFELILDFGLIHFKSKFLKETFLKKTGIVQFKNSKIKAQYNKKR